MRDTSGTIARRLDFGDMPAANAAGRGFRNGLRLAGATMLRGPEKYKELHVRRRRAQIRARRALGLV